MNTKKLFQSKVSSPSVDVSLLILRLASSLMIIHGWDKLINFEQYVPMTYSLWGLPQHICLALLIFAELLCPVAILIGFFTRAFVVPILFAMFVAAFLVHLPQDGLKGMEHALLYFLMYIILLMAGPGKYSFDKLIFNQR